MGNLELTGDHRLVIGGREAEAVAAAWTHVGRYSVAPLMEGSNQSLLANGSVTPKVYEAGPGAGVVWHDCIVRLVLEGGKVFDTDGFGNGAALSAGLSLVLGGTTLPFLLQSNADFASSSTRWRANANATTNGWLEFEWDVGPLVGDDSDAVSITVSEDLSGRTSPAQVKAFVIHRLID